MWKWFDSVGRSLDVDAFASNISRMWKEAAAIGIKRPAFSTHAAMAELYQYSREFLLLRDRAASDAEAMEKLLATGKVQRDVAYRFATLTGLAEKAAELLPAAIWSRRVDPQRSEIIEDPWKVTHA